MITMNAIFIATGSELLEFRENKYPLLISKKLSEISITLKAEMTVKDDLDEIKNAISYGLSNYDIIVISGGLGPTFDDHTRKAVSIITKKKIVFSRKLSSLFKKRYNLKRLTSSLENQCYVIEDAIIIENEKGTAPGELIPFKNKMIILLPGPKNEWEGMWSKIKNLLTNKFKNNAYENEILRFKIADITEAELEELLKPVILNNFTILNGPNICEFVIKSTGKEGINYIKENVEKILKERIYGYGDDTLEEVLGRLLRTTNKTLSTAESITSGLLSHKLTNIPKSSMYYIGGVNAYSNRIKQEILKVKEETLLNYGAVSKETAYEMAENVRKIFKTDYSIAITGIAGPDGGSIEKPVGLVYFAISTPDKTIVEKRIFSQKDRLYIKEASANTAIFLLYNLLKYKKDI